MSPAAEHRKAEAAMVGQWQCGMAMGKQRIRWIGGGKAMATSQSDHSNVQHGKLSISLIKCNSSSLCAKPTAACAHHQALQRSQTHTGVHAAATLSRCKWRRAGEAVAKGKDE